MSLPLTLPFLDVRRGEADHHVQLQLLRVAVEGSGGSIRLARRPILGSSLRMLAIPSASKMPSSSSCWAASRKISAWARGAQGDGVLEGRVGVVLGRLAGLGVLGLHEKAHRPLRFVLVGLPGPGDLGALVEVDRVEAEQLLLLRGGEAPQDPVVGVLVPQLVELDRNS